MVTTRLFYWQIDMIIELRDIQRANLLFFSIYDSKQRDTRFWIKTQIGENFWEI